jgi:ABC-type multidrug transport system fused ATPase/permease subunit
MQMMNVTVDSKITIDGVDLSFVSKEDIQRSVNVIAQEPFLLAGTLRLNVDPFGVATDEGMIKALERVGLWSAVQEKGGLGVRVDPTEWSTGQQQLLCFVRAILRPCKVLILDEAMSR